MHCAALCLYTQTQSAGELTENRPVLDGLRGEKGLQRQQICCWCEGEGISGEKKGTLSVKLNIGLCSVQFCSVLKFTGRRCK